MSTAAIDHVRQVAYQGRHSAVERIAVVLRSAGVTASVGALVEGVGRASVSLNFHPDRIAGDGRVVAGALLADGVYRTQFETRISNGGTTAHPGGDRDRWEAALFGGAYQAHGVGPQVRPRYGGLDLLGHPDGPCPRFGSCHLRLRPHVLARTTLCAGDSHLGLRDVGTVEAPELVIAALLEAAARGRVLGAVLDVAGLVGMLHGSAPRCSAVNGRVLDDYVEAQVHGPVRLGDDVEALVIDPSFDGTAIGDLLGRIAERFGLVLDRHPGFELAASAVPASFRGPAIPVLAERIGREHDASVLHAELVGRAARSVVMRPGAWADWGTPAEVLQHIKQLWHVLVRYGQPSIG